MTEHKPKELMYLEKQGYKIVQLESLRETTDKIDVKTMFYFVSDTRKKHESGFPFIRIFGELENKELVDLGWHDHWYTNIPVNIDAYTKNLFHIMSWAGIKFYLKPQSRCWTSTFSIEKDGELR